MQHRPDKQISCYVLYQPLPGPIRTPPSCRLEIPGPKTSQPIRQSHTSTALPRPAGFARYRFLAWGEIYGNKEQIYLCTLFRPPRKYPLFIFLWAPTIETGSQIINLSYSSPLAHQKNEKATARLGKDGGDSHGRGWLCSETGSETDERLNLFPRAPKKFAQQQVLPTDEGENQPHLHFQADPYITSEFEVQS